MDFTILHDVLIKYGWPGMIGFVLIIILFWVIKNQFSKTNREINKGFEYMADTLKQQNEQMGKILQNHTDSFTNAIRIQHNDLVHDIQETNKQLLNYMLTQQQQKHQTSIDTRIDLDAEINDKVHELLISSHANRTAIIEFHNSKENFDGLAFVWYDIHYEKFTKGTDDIMMKVQNLPTSLLTPIVQGLKQNNYILWDTNDLENMFEASPGLYNQLKRIPNLKLVLFMGIYNTENRLKGLLIYEWHKEIDKSVIIDNIDDYLTDNTTITSLINLKNQQEQYEG